MVSRETQLAEYVALIKRWRTTINLVSQKEAEDERLWAQVHLSRAIAPYVPDHARRFIDLGSGQGFPAIPLAIETGLEVDLVEADRRKAAFLTTVLAQLGLVGRVWPVRIEQAAVPPAICITARALAPLDRLVGLAKPLLQANGCCLFLKGGAVAAEMQQMRSEHECDAEIIPLHPTPSCLVKVSALR